VWSFGQDPGFHHDLEGGVLLRPGAGSDKQVAVELRGLARGDGPPSGRSPPWRSTV
jgi:hypothetical protein